MSRMIRKAISVAILVAFTNSSIVTPGYTQAVSGQLLHLPAPGAMVNLSPSYEPALIKGLTIHKDNPFLFDFIVDPGQSKLPQEVLKEESDRMIKYFFAAMTVPDKDVWVNLSPYEKNRMVPQSLGETAMGRDLLAQDYLLKQLTASLIYPQSSLGKSFWEKVYAKAQKEFGTTNIPVNTFNKVWIMPQRVGVYEHGQTAYIVDSHLKVMLEEDYLATTKHNAIADPAVVSKPSTNQLGSQIIRQIILPEIEKEVNEGKNFATLRQIFYAQALAVWFKHNLKQSLLNQAYANKGMVKGIDQNTAATNEAIYQQYIKAYKKGVFNYIKEDIDPVTQETLPRKYFSGGYSGQDVARAMVAVTLSPQVQGALNANAAQATDVTALLVTDRAQAAVLNRNVDAAMLTEKMSEFLQSMENRKSATQNSQIQAFIGNGVIEAQRAVELAKEGETPETKAIEVIDFISDILLQSDQILLNTSYRVETTAIIERSLEVQKVAHKKWVMPPGYYDKNSGQSRFVKRFSQKWDREQDYGRGNVNAAMTTGQKWTLKALIIYAAAVPTTQYLEKIHLLDGHLEFDTFCVVGTITSAILLYRIIKNVKLEKVTLKFKEAVLAYIKAYEESPGENTDKEGYALSQVIEMARTLYYDRDLEREDIRSILFDILKTEGKLEVGPLLKRNIEEIYDAAMTIAPIKDQDILNRMDQILSADYDQPVRQFVIKFMNGTLDPLDALVGIMNVTNGKIDQQAAQWLLDSSYLTAVYDLTPEEFKILRGHLTSIPSEISYKYKYRNQKPELPDTVGYLYATASRIARQWDGIIPMPAIPLASHSYWHSDDENLKAYLQEFGYSETVVLAVMDYTKGGTDLKGILATVTKELGSQEAARWLLDAGWLAARYELSRDGLSYVRDHNDGILQGSDFINTWGRPVPTLPVARKARQLYERWLLVENSKENTKEFINLNLRLSRDDAAMTIKPVVQAFRRVFNNSRLVKVETAIAARDYREALEKVFLYETQIAARDEEKEYGLRKILNGERLNFANVMIRGGYSPKQIDQIMVKEASKVIVNGNFSNEYEEILRLSGNEKGRWQDTWKALFKAADEAKIRAAYQFSARPKTESDKAALANPATAKWVQGGIDLSEADAAMRVTKGADGGVVVNVDPALIARIEAKGISEAIPVIINMKPADLQTLFQS